MKIYNLQFMDSIGSPSRKIRGTIYKKTFWVLLIVVYCLWLMTLNASAFSAEVRIDSGREAINAIEGVINVPEGLVVEDIHDGNSSVLIWIKRPSFNAENRTVSFSGITPGGFSGDRRLFTITGDFGIADLPRFGFTEILALKNDGSGMSTPASLSLKETTLAMDSDPPEPFSLELASSPDIFEGDHFLSFTTQDKGTGVDRYEYASSWFIRPGVDDAWQRAQSPQKLSSLEKFQRLYVRAIDREGNFRTVSTAGPYWPITLTIGIIIVVCVALFITRSLSLPSSPSASQ